MTLKGLMDRCGELIAKNPELADQYLALRPDGTLETAEFVFDEEPSRENDWDPPGRWKHGAHVACIELERFGC